MKLLLTSFLHPYIPEFVSGKIAYIDDATRSFADQPWVEVERRQLREMGLELINLPMATTDPKDAARILDEVDGVYVAGGETYDLLWALRSTGNFEVLKEKVEAGLPYIGTSAGSVLAAPDIDYVRLLDNADIAPELTDYTGLHLTEYAVVPHVGDNPPFTLDKFAEIVRTYGADYKLVLLRDGEVLRIEDGRTELI
ncbi:Type 1 glutamine amidotransferase-like domain-containing protein [Corynebacterium lubricantis]|uniref:Type 1 glutamine amidotransferase-like domain-containing protein n=1 Tax=Corynebacterium lubricantis TaxID=541095 RepID=UPI0003AA7B4C|nr:Type 1 glutamine amidotransferase-like domain-containing protein [Corynebacterium lubricantis]